MWIKTLVTDINVAMKSGDRWIGHYIIVCECRNTEWRTLDNVPGALWVNDAHHLPHVSLVTIVPWPRHDRVNASSFQAIVDTQSPVIKSLLPQVPITVFSFDWHTISDLWTISCRWQHKPLSWLPPSASQSKCHKPILIFAIFQIYTKLPITNYTFSEKQITKLLLHLTPGPCKHREDKIIVGWVLSAGWWCWDSSGLISADPEPGLTDHILPFPSPDREPSSPSSDNGRGVLDPTLWSLRPGARTSAQVINLAK